MRIHRNGMARGIILFLALPMLLPSTVSAGKAHIHLRVTSRKLEWKSSPVLVSTALFGIPQTDLTFKVFLLKGESTEEVPFIQKTSGFPPCLQALAWIKKGGGAAEYRIEWSASRERACNSVDEKIPLVGIGEPLALGSGNSVGWMTAGYNSCLDVSDLDGDGDPDLLAVFAGEPEVDTLRGTFYYENLGPNQPGILSPPYRISENTGSFTLTDWNYDGQADLVGSGWVRLNQSTGNGINFSEPDSIEGFPTGVWDICDLDGDGKLDLIIGQGDGKNYRPDPASYDPAREPPYTEKGVWKGGHTIGSLLFISSFRDNSPEQNGSKSPVLLADSTMGEDAWGGWFPDAVDWDQDGDEDVLVGSLFGLHLLENRQGQFPLRSIDIPKTFPHPGIHLRPRAVDWDLDGDLDILIAQESGFITLCENAGGDALKPPVPLKGVAPRLDAGCLSTPSLADWNGDGIPDLISGNSYGQLLYYESNQALRNDCSPFAWKSTQPETVCSDGQPVLIQAGPNGSIQGPEEARYGYTNPEFCDWDGDGLIDLLLGDVWGATRWYQNTGTPTQPCLGKPQSLGVNWPNEFIPKPAWCWFDPDPGELLSIWRTKPESIDWNRDGLIDLVTLDHEGFLSLFLRSVNSKGTRLLNPGQRIFLDQYGKPIHFGEGPAGRAGRGKFDLVDWDQDGDTDLLAYEFDSMKSIGYYENTRNNTSPVMCYRGDLLTPSGVILAGHSTTPCAVDFDADGHLDLLVGCEDGLVYAFHRAFIERDLPIVSRIED